MVNIYHTTLTQQATANYQFLFSRLNQTHMINVKQSVDHSNGNKVLSVGNPLMLDPGVLYQRLFQNMFESVVIYNFEEEKILDCNESTLTLLGYTKKEFLNKNRFDIVPKESIFFPGVNIHEVIRESHKEVVFKGDSICSTLEAFHKNGKRLFVKISVVSLAAGSYIGFVVVQDITKEVEKQKELEEKSRRKKIILNNSSEGIIYYSLHSRKIIDCNERAVQNFAFQSKQSFLNYHAPHYFVSGLEHELLSLEHFNQVIQKAQEKPYTFIYKAKNQKGEQRVMEGRAVHDVSDEKHPKLIFFTRDITVKRNAQEEMKRLFNQQKQIMNAIPAPFLFKDLSNNIIACNKAFAKKINFDKPHEVAGKKLFDFLSEEEIIQTQKSDSKLIASSNGGFSKIKQVIKNDRKKWYQNDKSLFRDSQGNIIGILSYWLDITEIMEKNERLKAYIESNQQLNYFASIASHDLQAPLRTIKSFTQLLHRKIKNKINEEEKEYMEFITNATDNMRHLIRDLRTFSQVDAGQLNIEQFCFETMVNEILSEIQSAIRYTNALIEIRSPLPTIKGDRIKLKQLIQNILTNALKYIEKGVRPHIIISFQEHSMHWYFELKDNGIGISEEFHNKVFELFRRLHANTDDYKGTGIGLALCKKIVEQHQGEIGIQSSKGDGSTFYFTLAKKIENMENMEKFIGE